MRHRPSTSTALLATLLLTGVIATSALADSHYLPPRKNPVRPQQPVHTFTVSGEFSGAVAGTLVIDGQSYQLAQDATVYELGKGPVPVGTVYNYRHVCVSGIQTAGSVLVSSVVVRPARNMALVGTDASVFVRVADPARPR